MARPYRRTVSFQNPTPNPNPNLILIPKSKHVRSISLPCGRTHPLIPQLRDQFTDLRSRSGPGRVVDGLTRLKSVLDSFDDVLQLPQTLDSLSSKTDVVERLLEDFLTFVDVYEVFHVSMLGLKQEVSSAQMGIRTMDGSNLGLYVKAQKKIGSEISKLISTLESTTTATDEEFHDELGGVINDVHQLVVSVSKTVFDSVSGSLGPGRKPVWAGFGVGKKDGGGGGVEEIVEVVKGVEKLMESKKKKKKDKKEKEEMKREVLKRMHEMEECVGEFERVGERVFRSLITTRVSLLNILTHA
ncbi:hypothetical protein RND81_02G061300 [Saponaria officinalis]|uniref:Uncharacterized protein n=1 Tax=Saponaria officinalis TaxID=3572 RepID=A0AAW1MVY5_SAPOF